MTAMQFPKTIDEWTGEKGADFRVRQIGEHHRRVIVTTRRGYVYAQTWAADCDDPPLSHEEIETVWRDDRRSFRPFDTSTASYL